MDRPRWRIVGERHELWLLPWGAEPTGRGERLDPREARRALLAALAAAPRWGLAERALAECARHLRGRFARSAAVDGGDAAAVLEAVARGAVTVWREERRNASAPLGELDADQGERVPLATELIPKTWIEIELTDMEGNPCAGERYWIKLTDGSVREGALDRYGRAYFGDLDPGECDIRWPDLDEEATVPTSNAGPQTPQPPRERTWLEVELVDMEGNPVADERYTVTLPDGTLRSGRTDALGVGRLAGIDPGECEVRWPDLDQEAVVALRS